MQEKPEKAPDSAPESSTTKGVRRGRGRPKKAEIAVHKPGGGRPVGRPRGDAAIINEYKARMLASPKSALVLQKVLDTALDDDHKHQAICLKLVIDRLLPLGYFEKEGQGNAQIKITMNIGDGGSASISPMDPPVDAEYTDNGYD